MDPNFVIPDRSSAAFFRALSGIKQQLYVDYIVRERRCIDFVMEVANIVAEVP
jgi:hypothetical protein